MNNFKIKNIILTLLFTNIILGQQALHNYGNLKVHLTGQIGFHIDVINDGLSNDNKGFAGFYNSNIPLSFSGLNQMNFEDFEVDVDDDLNIFTSLGITNNVDFTNGRINTPRTNQSIRLKFLNDNIYNGEGNNEHIDGYTQFEGNFSFLFPIGDEFEIKPLGIDNFIPNYEYVASYFLENPNIPTTFSTSFNTNNFDSSLDIVSTVEFWYFDGLKNLDLTLTWTNSSNIALTSNNLNNLRIAGWDDTQNQWVNLGNDSTTGNLNNGTITSKILNSENYKIYTIASILKAGNDIVIFNGITPDGDGLNDTLVIRGLENLGENQLSIYNRWGRLVFQKDNYDNSFGGISNVNTTINKDEQLVEGTYYYVFKITNQQDIAGYLYINR